jgi:hypothetical protein
MDCDFDNDAMTCPACGFKAGARDWRRNCAAAKKPGIRGLGDVVARVTDALGIPKCGGCAKRQELLNTLVPFKPASQR